MLEPFHSVQRWCAIHRGAGDAGLISRRPQVAWTPAERLRMADDSASRRPLHLEDVAKVGLWALVGASE